MTSAPVYHAPINGNGASTLQIDFCPSERATLGVEVELELVDRQTRELCNGASEILAVLEGPGPKHPKVKHELLECTLEVITGICDTVAGARADLETTLAEV